MLLSKCACKYENFSTKDDLFKKNIYGENWLINNLKTRIYEIPKEKLKGKKKNLQKNYFHKRLRDLLIKFSKSRLNKLFQNMERVWKAIQIIL